MTETEPEQMVASPPSVVLAPTLALLLERTEAFKMEGPAGGKDSAELYEVTFKSLIPAQDVAVLFQLCKQHTVLAEIQQMGGGKL